MKKYVIGAFIGCLLTFSFQVAADGLVGSKVQGTLPVYVNGVQTSTPAVVIDGTSFLPVRSVGESMNYKVSYDETKKVVNVENFDLLSLDELNQKVDSINTLIKSRQGTIELFQLQIDKGNLSDEGKQENLQRIAAEQEKNNNLEAIKQSVIQAIAERQ